MEIKLQKPFALDRWNNSIWPAANYAVRFSTIALRNKSAYPVPSGLYLGNKRIITGRSLGEMLRHWGCTMRDLDGIVVYRQDSDGQSTLLVWGDGVRIAMGDLPDEGTKLTCIGFVPASSPLPGYASISWRAGWQVTITGQDPEFIPVFPAAKAGQYFALTPWGGCWEFKDNRLATPANYGYEIQPTTMAKLELYILVIRRGEEIVSQFCKFAAEQAIWQAALIEDTAR